MPIYEYYCPDNHRIYQFFAKTLAQGRTVPKCPDNPKFRMEKVVSAFAVGGRAKEEAPGGKAEGDGDPRMDAAMAAMEKEFANVDENDPRGMGRMMRRMAELSGEKIDGEMEEVVRKLEEGADPDSLEDQFGEGADGEGAEPGADAPGPAAEPPARRGQRRFQGPAIRDPKLYDYE